MATQAEKRCDLSPQLENSGPSMIQQDHNYTHESNSKKRNLESIYETPLKKSRRKLNRNSNELLEVSRASLNLLSELSENVTSIANSLKIIANVMQHFQ